MGEAGLLKCSYYTFMYIYILSSKLSDDRVLRSIGTDLCVVLLSEKTVLKTITESP